MFLSKEYKSILIVASHPDDEIIGCGGTLVKLAKLKKKIQIIFLSDSTGSRFKKKSSNFFLHLKKRKNTAKKICKFLKIKPPIFYDYSNISHEINDFYEITTKLSNEIKTNRYDIVFTHSYSDNNRDHRLAFETTLNACRPINNKNNISILTFETNSATDYSVSQFKKQFSPNFFVNITNQIKIKKKLLKFYNYELKNYPHSRSLENIINLAKIRGSSIHSKFAEAFEIVRLKNE